MENAALTIVKTLQTTGYEAYYAGGCVRDRLRGVEPKDFDIATSARPDEILKLYPKGDRIGEHFGVILVRHRGIHFEIATFREDGVYRDGRHPDSVTYSTSEVDARRRDFTINGMFYDPVAERLLDFVGGEKDLKAGLIRAIGNPQERFEEDYLRMLRAVRFATLFGFAIDPLTWSSIQSIAPKISQISPERVREELDQIWTNPNRLEGFDVLVASGLMEAILPEIMNLQGCEQPPQWHPEGDVFVHTRLMLSLLGSDASLPLVLSVLFHDIAKPATQTYDSVDNRIRFSGHDKLGAEMAEQILRRLRYSNAVISAVISGVAHHMQFKDVQKMRTATLKRFMARDHFSNELELHRVDCLGGSGNLENHHFLLEKEREFDGEPIVPKRFINGSDLLSKGVPGGPGLGDLLTEIQDLQLDGSLTSREEALTWLENRLSPQADSKNTG